MFGFVLHVEFAFLTWARYPILLLNSTWDTWQVRGRRYCQEEVLQSDLVFWRRGCGYRGEHGAKVEKIDVYVKTETLITIIRKLEEASE